MQLTFLHAVLLLQSLSPHLAQRSRLGRRRRGSRAAGVVKEMTALSVGVGFKPVYHSCCQPLSLFDCTKTETQSKPLSGRLFAQCINHPDSTLQISVTCCPWGQKEPAPKARACNSPPPVRAARTIRMRHSLPFLTTQNASCLLTAPKDQTSSQREAHSLG